MRIISVTNLIVLTLIFVSFIWKDEFEIIENDRIGNYTLSLKKNQLVKLKNVKLDTLHKYEIYSLPNIKIWYDTIKNRTDQICACNDHKGKFRNSISLNSKVSDLRNISKFYFWKEEEVYQFKSINGICFDIPEEQLNLPMENQIIDAICVFRESKLKMRIKNIINRKDFEFVNK